MTETKSTILNAVAVGLLLAIGPTHGAAQSADAAPPDAKKAVAFEAVTPPGIAAVEIPPFPSQIARTPLVAKLSELALPCGGQTASATADSVDAAAGQRDTPRGQALANLVMTENMLSPSAAQSIILALGRYPGSNDVLRKLIKHAHAIATRQYDAQQETEGKSIAPAEAVIASMEQDILMAVIGACKLAHTPAMKALLGELANSKNASVAEMAKTELADWSTR